MSELTIQTLSLPAAEMGAPNPLPPIRRRRPPAASATAGDLPASMQQNMAYGHAPSLLPYAMQDAYTRRSSPQEHPVAVLENPLLRAVFLLDYGGRLWSLYHKPSQSELLAQSPSLTFCNLGLRNAWFRGGVEWNVGTIGHSPLTCSPVFAARLDDEAGCPVLRLYEWERLRQVIVQVDAWLPESAPVLFVRPRVINPGTEEVPLYWWSNLAVPLTPNLRVLAPATGMYLLQNPMEGLRHRPVPVSDGFDVTYPEKWQHAADLFFDLRAEAQPWIAAVSARGEGIFHVSKGSLPGRKLWVWGTSQGGRNWQKFLSPDAEPYIEIQAGLTRTQLEHLPLAPRSDRAWIEAMGYVQVDPAQTHGEDWNAACRHVEQAIGETLPPQGISAASRLGAALADHPPGSILHRGSGWGSLERRRREMAGQGGLDADGVPFDDLALGPEQAPWLKLLHSGTLPTASPRLPPQGFLVGDEWRASLERSLQEEGKGTWDGWLHLGVMRWFSGDDAGAESAWRRSLSEAWTPWACRNLAALHWEMGRLTEAADLMLAACRGQPSQLELLVECGTLLIEANRSRDWLDLIAGAAAAVRAHSRIRLLEAQAALAAGELPTVEKFLEERIVPEDLREGETSLTDLWFGFHEMRLRNEIQAGGERQLEDLVRERCPIPPELDFAIR